MLGYGSEVDNSGGIIPLNLVTALSQSPVCSGQYVSKVVQGKKSGEPVMGFPRITDPHGERRSAVVRSKRRASAPQKAEKGNASSEKNTQCLLCMGLHLCRPVRVPMSFLANMRGFFHLWIMGLTVVGLRNGFVTLSIQDDASYFISQLFLRVFRRCHNVLFWDLLTYSLCHTGSI